MKLNHIALIITNDYEVQGDGRGDVKETVIRPTTEILRVCGEFGVPHTLFVDVLEFLKFREAEDKRLLSPTYCGGSMMAEQLREAISAGHDVQLHLHPQWLDAKPLQDDCWEVNNEYWRLSQVPNGLGDRNDLRSLRGLFSLGKRTLEELLRPIRPDYKCIAFRAGGYCIQPEGEILQAMREEGFRIDSSVMPGRHLDKDYVNYDFRLAPRNLPYWRVSNSVTRCDPEGEIVEVPIFTDRFIPLFRVRSMAKKVLITPGSSTHCGNNVTVLRLDFFKRAVGRFIPRWFNLDFCKLTAREMIRSVERARDAFRAEKKVQSMPLVMTGHSKEWRDGKDFRRFLEWASGQNWIKFTTFPEWYEECVLRGC